MSTVLCFRSADVAYGLPVDAARAVRTATGITALPSPRPDVAGILPGDPPLTVFRPLGREGSCVVVVSARGRTFGVLVDSVSGLHQLEETHIDAAPDGQAQLFVAGTTARDGQLLLLLDPEMLAATL